MARSLDEARAALTEARERRDRLMTDLGGIQARARNGDADAGLQERAANLNRGIESADSDITEAEAEVRDLEARQSRIADLARSGEHVENGTAYPERRRTVDQPGTPGAARSDALRAVERMADTLGSEAGDRLTSVIERDRSGVDSRYVAAVSNPAYEQAFARRLASPDGAPHEYTAEEAEAMRNVAQVAQERALAVGSGGTGGFAVPATLDPTIMLTSDGALSPLRQLAQVTSVTTDEWRGVSSAGVTAAFDAEAAQVGDDSPTLTQPSIRPEKAHAFVPFSIEVGQDWPTLQAELVRLFADAKDVLEAEKFLAGAGHGSDEPEGVIAGLAPSSVVGTAGAALAADDVYTIQEALPPRFQPRAVWASANAPANRIHRFQSDTEPPLFNEGRDRLLGKPWHEVSGMDTGDVDGQKVLLYGDLGAGFRIVDRIGMTVELVPHLFGADRRPTGQRGLYAYWRVSSAVVVDNAIRLLEIGAGSGSGSGS